MDNINNKDQIKESEVTVLLLTYNPNLNKLLTTLHSILLQKNVNIQIVISDDGSKESHMSEAEHYLKKQEFHNYRILLRKQNGGMVAGTYDALKLCKGKWLKMISPGDYLYGENSLRNWIDFMERNKLGVSYADAIYYRWHNNRIKPVRVKNHPQHIGGGIAGYIHQLVYDDIWLGAAVLADTDLMRKYIVKIYPHVKYAEDHVYRFMAYAGEKCGYFQQCTLLYEYGTGISTAGEDVWSLRLKRDWEEADKILVTQHCNNSKLRRMVKYRIKMKKKESVFSRHIFGFFHLPTYYINRMRQKIFPRYSCTDPDERILNEIVSLDN